MNTRIVEHMTIRESVGDGLYVAEAAADKKHRAVQDFIRLTKEVRAVLAQQTEEV